MNHLAQKLLAICTLLCIFSCIGFSQTTAAPTQPLQPDRLKEDVVAKVFEQIRTAEKVPHLKRIKSRRELEEITCSLSMRGNGKPYSAGGGALYKTSTPEIATPELEKVAEANYRWNRRYSVAVWPVRGDDATAQFWVSIHQYSSAGLEFFDNNFTDDLFYKDDWKQRIAPECKKVH